MPVSRARPRASTSVTRPSVPRTPGQVSTATRSPSSEVLRYFAGTNTVSAPSIETKPYPAGCTVIRPIVRSSRAGAGACACACAAAGACAAAAVVAGRTSPVSGSYSPTGWGGCRDGCRDGCATALATAAPHEAWPWRRPTGAGPRAWTAWVRGRTCAWTSRALAPVRVSVCAASDLADRSGVRSELARRRRRAGCGRGSPRRDRTRGSGAPNTRACVRRARRRAL